jgi:hypothetical protein
MLVTFRIATFLHSQQLFDCLLPATLRNYLQKQNSIFVLLACGAAVTHKPSFNDILGLATR